MRCPLNGTAVSRLRECHCRFLLPGGPRRPPVGLWGQAWQCGPARRRQPRHAPVPTKTPREAAGSSSMGPSQGPMTSPPGDDERHRPGSALGPCWVSAGTRPSRHTRGSPGKVRPAPTLGSTQWPWEDAAPPHEDPGPVPHTLCRAGCPRPAIRPRCALGPCSRSYLCTWGRRAGQVAVPSGGHELSRHGPAALGRLFLEEGGQRLSPPPCTVPGREGPACAEVQQGEAQAGCQAVVAPHGTAMAGCTAPSAHAMAASRRAARGHPMPTQGASPGAQRAPWGGTLPHASLHHKPCSAGAAVP